MNIKEASKAANISVRALRYYEEVGLIQPSRTSENGYREYDETIIHRARLIRAYRELQFSLDEIRSLLEAPRMERDRMLEQQIDRLEAKRQAIDNRIALARSLRMNGPERFTEIDFSDFDEQMARAQQLLPSTPEWRSVSEKLNALSKEESDAAAQGLVEHLAAVALADDPGTAIRSLIRFIDENLYPCTDIILAGFARSFGGDGLLAQAVEEISSPGSARILRERLEAYIKNTACK